MSASPAVERIVVDGLSSFADWRAALAGCDGVVHAAARVHVMKDTANNPLAEFRAANVDATERLARQAAEFGVRRFVYISSIKVNGEATAPGAPFKADDDPAPIDPYGVSKFEAEVALARVASDTGLEIVVIRPVLVYGPGVRANFRSMMRWLHRGVPLPFGSTHNLRSLVALDNLVDLVVCTLRHPAAANQKFLISDGEDVSTEELLRRTAHALGRSALLIPVPPGLMHSAAALFGQASVANRLFGTLQVDIEKAKVLLGWSPPFGLTEALQQTANHFLAHDAG